MQKFIITINEPNQPIVADEQIACYVLSTCLPQTELTKYISNIRNVDKLILLQGSDSPDLCQKYRCDGVLLEIDDKSPYKKQILPVRDKLGNKKIIGAIIPLLRHAAMIIGETEPEFVTFKLDSIDEMDKAKKIVEWYNELFLIQSAVVGQVDSRLLMSLETDFVLISPKNYKILVAKNESLD